MKKFLLWLPSWGETEDDAREVCAWDAECAAESWMEEKHGDLDYIDDIDIDTKDESGIIAHYNVVAEPIIKFRAYEKKENK